MMFYDGNNGRFLCKWIVAIIIIGVIIRMLLGVLLTYNYDAYYWALTISNFEGGNGLYDVEGYFYSPVWGYMLGILSSITEFFGLGSLGERIPELLFTENDPSMFAHKAFVTSLGFNASLAALMTVFDLISGYLIYWIVSEQFHDEKKAKICFAIWFLCPFVIIIGSVGVMFDSLSALLLLLCVSLLFEEKEFLAGIVMTTAVLTKFFPGFLLFVLVAYVILKYRNKTQCIRKLAIAACGVVTMAVVILLPELINGDVTQCFSFLTSRLSGNGTSFGNLQSSVQTTAYIVVLLLSVYIALRFLKSDRKDLNMTALWFISLNCIILFICPSTPQYILLMTPFLIMMAVNMDSRLMKPFYLLIIGTTMFAMSPLVMDLTSISVYTDLFPIESLISIYNGLQSTVFGISWFDVYASITGILQYSATIWAIYVMATDDRTKKVLFRNNSL